MSILLSVSELYRNNDSRNALYAILSGLPQVLFTYNKQHHKLEFCNTNRLISLLEYNEEDVHSWNNDMLHMICPEDHQLFMDHLQTVYTIPHQAYHNFECRVSHKSGKLRHVKISGAVLDRNADGGESDSFLFSMEDNTAKTNQEKTIETLLFRLQDAEELLEYGSWTWELQNDKLHWSNGMYTILEYNEEEIHSKLSAEFYFSHIIDKDIDTFREKLSASLRSKTSFEHRYTIRTGSQRHKVVFSKGRIQLQPDGTVDKICGITCDITSLTKTNHDLLSYKEMIMEREYFLNQGSWETNPETGETTWSRGMYNIFGYNTDKEIHDLRVTNELPFTYMSEEEVAESKEKWNRILENEDSYAAESSIIARDGKHKFLETFGKVIRNGQGLAEKVIGTTRDVTSLHQYKISLEEKINELNHRNNDLEGFAYIASHDLQEPLRKLTAFSERLQAKFKHILGEEGQMYLDRINVSTENMRLLIDNLLEFSHTARSNKHFFGKDLSKLLEEAKSDLELKIEESGTVINSSPLPVIEVIPSQIKQLFNNLLSNSIKFKIADRLPVITVSCEKLSSTEKNSHNLRTSKEYYKFTFSDNGIGFEPEYSEKIFQLFQRLHGKHEYPGSGIGLAICKKIVDNHDGIIYAQSEISSGCVFTIILPEHQS